MSDKEGQFSEKRIINRTVGAKFLREGLLPKAILDVIYEKLLFLGGE